MGTLAERIQHAMKVRGMSQADLARATGIATSNIAYDYPVKTKKASPTWGNANFVVGGGAENRTPIAVAVNRRYAAPSVNHLLPAHAQLAFSVVRASKFKLQALRTRDGLWQVESAQSVAACMQP